MAELVIEKVNGVATINGKTEFTDILEEIIPPIMEAEHLSYEMTHTGIGYEQMTTIGLAGKTMYITRRDFFMQYNRTTQSGITEMITNLIGKLKTFIQDANTFKFTLKI